MATIHARKFITADPEKCVGCGICEYICAFEKEKVFNPLKSRIRVVRLDSVINLAVACRLCEDAPCVAACPRDALTQSEETGIILVDEDKCNGCGWCIEACDYGAITLHPDSKTVIVCDLCGGEPKCVEWCPEEALDFVSKDILAQKARITVVKKLFQEAIKSLS
ncbi:4Fe-4S dicluster domain-containing protein [Candidatus Bathyarchaeota archaeon]|nr:MAG: 4Fe-4S ferredoxin [Candidatus Bathyarchaeota archaeon ex4484_40]RJS79747.1 MAG: 4Fe-4S dicluster domain-containing protein [Candidatus Bathyarchaeota archaeon]RLG97442.1 MAG: 4Fe-4S dicluster domain-containing protein [Candidatus Bathyarchaeota archaeon]